MRLLILTALQEEMLKIIKYYRPKIIFADKNRYLYKKKIENNIIYFGITGVGNKNVDKFFNKYMEIESEPDMVISSGYAGALDSSLRVGDVVVADYYICDNKSYDFKLHFGCEKVKYNLCIGMGVEKIFTLNEKLELKNRYKEVYFIDMESCATVRFCERNNIELIIVRAISDKLKFKFPDFRFITKSKKDLSYWMKLPANLGRLFFFRLNILKARKSIYRTIKSLIEKMSAA